MSTLCAGVLRDRRVLPAENHDDGASDGEGGGEGGRGVKQVTVREALGRGEGEANDGDGGGRMMASLATMAAGMKGEGRMLC